MKILTSRVIWFLLLGIFLTSISVDFVQGQTKKEIVKIRADVAAINKGVSKYTKTKKDVEGISLEGTEATYYHSAGKLRKITATMFGETYNAAGEFYYKNGELIFAYLKHNKYDMQIGLGTPPKVVRTTEQRFYFADDKLLQLLIGKKELKSGDERYTELKDEIVKISDVLKDS